MRGTLMVNAPNRIVAQVDMNIISASGRLNPRLNFNGEATLTPSIERASLEIYIRLEFDGELIGESRMQRVDVGDNGSQVSFEVVVSSRLLRFITDRLIPTQHSLNLDAQLLGHGTFTFKPADPSKRSVRVGDDPEPGVPKLFELAQNHVPIAIDRAEWYQSVLGPTKGEQYRFMEVALPRSDQELARDWGNAVAQLQEAEKAYSVGDDAAVFLYLRGAIDALPGATQHICDSIQDLRKKTAVDELVKQVGKYFHLGRHVSSDGPEEGRFPVDHLDAAFALDLARTTLSHLSLILSAEAER
ncbi:hypothetical protein [Ferrimicrobium sp.]|uniref:hypothetical protein n=1 Tax=Ferrimicrobium sp. TaxID=2926050 RepID=UPI0026358FF4|nr:hypothetical protein [Ferrimicrobium sp.]